MLLTDEQRMIQSMVREFSRKVLRESAMERDKTKAFPKDNLKKMAGLGLLGMTVPDQYGGAGADAVSYALALMEIAYSCASTAVIMSVHNSIVCETLNYFGNEEQKNHFLKKMAQGKMIGAFALTEPHAGSDPVDQLTTAVCDADTYVINGNKRFITSGKNAGLIIVTAKTDESQGHRGISAFLVPQGTPGLQVGKEEDKMGLRASDTVDLTFNNCRVPKENLLGKEGEGFKIAMKALDSGRIGIAAQSVGVAQAALDESINYSKHRVQFGRPISKFQNTRFVLAEMATQIEAAKQLMLSAALMKDQGLSFSRQASMAKLFASEMVNQITAKAVQIHGGYGFIKEYTVERLYRDARVFTIYEGTSEIQKIVISSHLLKDR
ncbi:MAG: acyl-CoA dehydrogenase family protein [Candidatus Magnetomorum sp.]|nr:acyl-CoA dehydrogenase family protein [Candidatus Magnetomorum sp.]